MLAPTAAPAAEKPVVKHRTITLTNRAPIKIVEDEWPVIAQGASGYDVPGAPWELTVEIRVRQHKQHDWRYIIHANYLFSDVSNEDTYQTVRVGRLETITASTMKGCADYQLWQHIKDVADELRTRIDNENLRKYVTYAVDACFAKLTPHQL